MRKYDFILLAILVVCHVKTTAQQKIENTDVPSSANAGREITLIPKSTIKDVGDDYYYSGIQKILIDEAGAIYLSDGEKIMQFKSNGVFHKKYKSDKNEVFFRNYFITGNKIYAYDMRNNELLIFNSDTGSIEKTVEIPTEYWPRMQFIMASEKNYYFLGKDLSVRDYQGNDKASINISQEGGEISSDGPIGTSITISADAVNITGDKIALINTSDYSIKIIDLPTNSYVKEIKRKYHKQESTSQPTTNLSISGRATSYSFPSKDILSIYRYGDYLFAKTSTFDPQKGQLFDVFDSDGIYVDNFYLKYLDGNSPVKILAIDFNKKEKEAVLFVKNSAGEVKVDICQFLYPI